MGVKILYGESLKDLTEECLRQIGELSETGSDRRAILLVPETSKMDMESEYLTRTQAKGMMQTQVFSFSRLCYQILGETGRTPRKYIDDIGKTMLVYRILSENADKFELYRNLCKRPGFVSQIISVMGELNRVLIGADSLEKASCEIEDRVSAQKAKELSILMREYEKALAGTDLTDPQDNYISATNIINTLVNMKRTNTVQWPFDRLEWLIGTRVWIVGFAQFRNFTPAEFALINALQECCEIVITIACDRNCMDIGKESYQKDFFYAGTKTYAKLVRSGSVYGEPVFVPSERAAAFEHLGECLKNQAPVPMLLADGEEKRVNIFNAMSKREEISLVAGEIKRLVSGESFRYRDISVMATEISGYIPIVSAIFRQAGIPIFVDDKKSLAKTALGRLISSLTDLIIYNWSHASVICFLRSGFSGMAAREVDEFETFLIANRIKWKNQLFNDARFCNEMNVELDGLGTDNNGETAQEIVNTDSMVQNAKGLDERTDFKGQELLRYRNTAFKNVLEFEKQISVCKTAGDYCNALHNFLINEDIESKIENFSKDLLGKGEDEGATALVKAWNELLHLLDQTREIGGETTLTFKDFRGILMSGMESAFAGTIPSSVDQVNFSQIKQITNKSPKILFVIGLSQEAYPPKTPPEGILKDRDRQVFSQYFNVEIPSVLSDKVYEDQFLTFTFLTLPKERIYLTCPKAREQESSVITFVRESFTGICEVIYIKDLSEVSPLDLQIYSKTSAVNSLTSRLPGENTVENGNDITNNPNSELLVDDNKTNSTSSALLHTVENQPNTDNDFVSATGNTCIQKEWYELDRVFGQNEEMKSKIQRLRSIAKKSKRKIGLERADMLECYREPVKMSVSQLETYSSCSYSHMMTYLLRLQPRVTWDVQETDAGSLLHGIAENCIKDFITDFNSAQSPQDKEKVIEKYRNMDFTCFAEAKMRDFCSDERYDTFLENGNKAARGRRAVNIAASTLKAIFGKIEYEDFIPERLEWKFSKDNGNAIKIQIPGLPDVFFNGIVDRVDSCGDYFRVIDYKSADKSVDFDMWYQGLSMQLLAYIAAYHQENPDKLPQDAAYLQFSRPIIKYEDMTPSKIREDHADKLLKAYRLKGPGLDSANLLLASRFAVQKMEQLTGNLLNGKYDIRPRKIAGKQLPCIYCDYSAICGFEQTFDEPLILDALPGKTGEDGKALKKANVFIETIAKECD